MISISKCILELAVELVAPCIQRIFIMVYYTLRNELKLLYLLSIDSITKRAVDTALYYNCYKYNKFSYKMTTTYFNLNWNYYF